MNLFCCEMLILIIYVGYRLARSIICVVFPKRIEVEKSHFENTPTRPG